MEEKLDPTQNESSAENASVEPEQQETVEATASEAVSTPTFCSNCGKQLDEGTAFCSSCGTPQNSATVVSQASPTKENKKKKKLPIIIAAVVAIAVVVVIAVVVIPGNSGPDFQEIFDACALDDSYADVASDGSYLTIDTNPNDIDDYIDMDAYEKIKHVNDALGLPDSLLETMNHTSASDGRQTEEFENLTVTWKYHPDNGLAVTYKKN